MFCPKCGSFIDEKSKYCSLCGESLIGTNSESTDNEERQIVKLETVNVVKKPMVVVAIVLIIVMLSSFFLMINIKIETTNIVGEWIDHNEFLDGNNYKFLRFYSDNTFEINYMDRILFRQYYYGCGKYTVDEENKIIHLEYDPDIKFNNIPFIQNKGELEIDLKYEIINNDITLYYIDNDSNSHYINTFTYVHSDEVK